MIFPLCHPGVLCDASKVNSGPKITSLELMVTRWGVPSFLWLHGAEYEVMRLRRRLRMRGQQGRQRAVPLTQRRQENADPGTPRTSGRGSAQNLPRAGAGGHKPWELHILEFQFRATWIDDDGKWWAHQWRKGESPVLNSRKKNIITTN